MRNTLSRCFILQCCAFIALLLSIPAYAQKEHIAEYRTALMGTNVSIKVKANENQKEHIEQAIDHAVSRMQAMVRLVSSWEPESDTSRINNAAGENPVSVDPRLIHILAKSRQVSDLSAGAFDITFSAVGKLWKLVPDHPVIPGRDAINEALAFVDYHKLIINKEQNTAQLIKKGMRIDLGGIAKGSVVDEGARSLLNDGISDFIIDAGGDLRIHSSSSEQPWPIGITHPRDPRGPVLAIVKMSDGAIVTSGDYEKMVEINGKRYHHIINPNTGYPVDHCISVTVLAGDAETADALSTAFFVMGPVKGLELCETLEGVEALFIDSHFEISKSSGFPEIAMMESTPNVQHNDLHEFSGKEQK